ncbi:MAG: squalene/phytoene synthase family protein [Anaerolineae bacterium]|nr:squalene/phytoene synthase family protein [Anaerolineae bacterium]
MSISTWEQQLLNRAYQGLHLPSEQACEPVDAAILARAYQHCTQVTRYHSHTFFLASALLPRPKRNAARALYAFCRISDDLVDDIHMDESTQLHAWHQHTLMDCPKNTAPFLNSDLIVLAWADARATYNIPEIYAQQLLDGVARDLVQTRYTTFAELAEYCYGVASTVGLMAMHIIGFSGPEAIPYAVKLGVALQLTNILRDVGEDWARGRFYLPQDELARFELTEDDLAARRVDDRWRAFLHFQIDRVRRLYAESLPGVAFLHQDGRFAIAAAAELYQAILADIEAHQMDNFNRRAYVGDWSKLRRLPGIWWRATIKHYR